MPRLLKLLSPRSKTPVPPPPGSLRRLSASKSTGDLVGLLNTEYAHAPLVPTFFPKVPAPTLPPPNPLALDDSVTCGYLYRLTYTGLWFTLWMELRFSYLLCFYEQTDDLPMDMTNLHGYTVRMAPECDHLEGLFPIKLIKKDERTIFLFADSEEGRIEWMAAFIRASSHRLPLTIEGLNLEFEGNDVCRSNTVTTLIRNIPDKKPETPSESVEENFDEECELLEDADEFEETVEEMKTRFSPNPDAEDILNKYDTAQALTEHEGLRIKTYYWQRRLSAQIKVQTLEEQLPHSENVSAIEQKSVEEKLLKLKNRLSELDVEKEQASKNVELTLHELETKKTEALKGANVSIQTHEPSDPKIKYIEEHKPKPRCSSASETEDLPPEEHKSRSFFRRKPSPLKLGRHQTFSPGDWALYPPGTTPNSNGNGTPHLKKAGSLTNLFHSLTTSKDPHTGSASPKTKWRSPKRLISNVFQGHQHKSAHSSDFVSNPSSPMTSPSTAPVISTLISPSFVVSPSGAMEYGTQTVRRRRDKPSQHIHWRHSSYENYLSPSDYGQSFAQTPDPLTPDATSNSLPRGYRQHQPNGSPYAIDAKEDNEETFAASTEVASNGSILSTGLDHPKKNKVRTKIKRMFTFNEKTTRAYKSASDAH